MAGVTLYDYQLDAVDRMKIGCILCGGVGSGKSRTSLAFYYRLYGGQINTKEYARMTEPPDLYIITTARKAVVTASNLYTGGSKTRYWRMGRGIGSFLHGDGPET